MKRFKNVIIGLIVLTIGLILGLNALEITKIDIFFDGWWTLFMIIPSFIGLFDNKNKTGNIIVLLIGVALLLCCQDLLDFDLILKLAIPMVLVIIGLSYIFKGTLNNKISEKIKEINKSDKKEYCSTFSSQKLSFENDQFENCSLTAVFGSIKCDLRDTDIKEDKVIDITTVFGGIDVFVPKDVNVKVVSTSIFGGVDNKIKNDDKNSKTIYINATCIFGGVDIK